MALPDGFLPVAISKEKALARKVSARKREDIGGDRRRE
jgi:hypothetical protein